MNGLWLAPDCQYRGLFPSRTYFFQETAALFMSLLHFTRACDTLPPSFHEAPFPTHLVTHPHVSNDQSS